MDNCGTLPDFGNFCIERDSGEAAWGGNCIKEYDRYKGVAEMMPFAKAVSAKTFIASMKMVQIKKQTICKNDEDCKRCWLQWMGRH